MYGGGGGQWPGQQQQQQPGQYMQPQQTGFMGAPQQRPMMTGQQGGSFLGAPQQMQPQPTGFAPGMNMGMGYNAGLGGLRQPSYGQPSGGMMGGGQQRFLSPNPMQMQSQPTGMMQPQQTGMMQPQQSGMMMQQQATGMMQSAQPRPMMGLQPQATGYPMQMQQTGLMPQMTGMPMDPRLQLMSMQFLPAAQPYSGAPIASNMNFSSASMQPASFQSSIQNLSQQQQGSKEPKIPWALSKEERKSYDSIFRAWDAKGTGFVSGDVAREVFGQSGLDRDRLMQVWHLSDTENRGKLNLAEFHVAMGLIYRALNGNDLPEHLPAELVPPSARDLNESVDFLKDLLKRDTNVRNTTGLNLPESGSNKNTAYGKTHSFHENPIQKQDAAAYKHSDDVGSGYKSSSRHLDRRTVRYGGESATDNLSEMKRQLAQTQKMLDDQENHDEEDREVEKEMDELRFRIKRVQDDIDYYNRRGGRDAGESRRKAERELMHLMHERLPLIEKRLEEKDRKQREKRVGESRVRDRRNEDFETRRGYSDDRYSTSRDYEDSSRSRTPSSRYDDRDRYDDRRDRDQGSSRSSPAPPPPAASKPPPAPAPAAVPVAAPTPPPAPSSPAVTSVQPKNMTPEEKLAWTRAEAQRRIQERMRALGLTVPTSAPLTPTATGQADSTVEHRLAADRAEAQAKASQADAEAMARDEARRARLEEQRLAQDKAAVKTVKTELQTQAESASALPAPVLQAAREEVDEQEEMLRRREEVLKKEKEERLARFKRLEEEEAEAARQEEAFKQKQGMFSAKSSALPTPVRKGKGGPPPPPPSRSKAASSAPAAPVAPAPPPAAAPLPSPVPPPAALSPGPAPVVATPSGNSSTNPFHRMQPNGSGAASSAPAVSPVAPAAPSLAAAPSGGNNPFFRSQQADSSGLPTPQRAAGPVMPVGNAPASMPKAAAAVRAPVDDDDWGEEHEHHDDDDADGPGSTTRATRQNLAQALFSGLVPASSPAPSTPTAKQGAFGAAPQSPAAPLAPAPPPPAAPPAPPAAMPSVPAPAAGPADRGALLGAIQGGLQLRKAKTNDRSVPAVSGAVIGDASAPVQRFIPPPSAPANEPAQDDVSFAGNPNRQSVDWASHLASDQMNGNPKASTLPEEPSVREEEDEDSDDFKETVENMDSPGLVAPNAVSSLNGIASQIDELDDFDMSKSIRVRSLYAYDGQRQEDLSFAENSVIIAHPAKDDGNDWWYGSLITGSKGLRGTFPRTYVQSIEKPKQAKALYDFTASSPEEMSFTAEQHLQIIDDEDEHWWKAIDEGNRILIVPSTYVELVNAAAAPVASTVFAWREGSGAVGNSNDLRPAAAVSATDGTPDDPKSRVGEEAQLPDNRKERNLSSSNDSALSTATDKGLHSLQNNDEPAPALDEDEELQKAIKESERLARLESVARARDEKDLKRTLELSAKEGVAGSDTSQEGDESDSTTGWTSSEEEESDEEEESEEAKQLRVAERIRVLEAAGILKLGGDAQSQLPMQAEDKMLRRKTIKKPKPERPERHVHKPKRPSRPPPARPQKQETLEVETDDAYDRYVKMSKEVQQEASARSEDSGKVPPISNVVVSLSPSSSPPPAGYFASTGSGLLNTIRGMTRIGAASPAERKVTPTISGPMSVRTNSPRVNSPTPTTASADTMASSQTLATSASEYSASSWSSIIGTPALADIPERERKRQEAIFELIKTEGTHVRDLQTVVEVFFNAMKDSPFLSPKAQTVIFANVEEVLLTAVSLLSELENRQKESRLYVTKIGDILEEHMKNMSTYLPYCVNQTTARQILMSERSRNAELDKVLVDLRNQHPAARGLDLSSFLLVPMQRLTRYPLLISQIVRYTVEDADQKEWKDLHSAMSASQRLLDTVNEAIRMRESNEKLQLISSNLSRGEVKLDLTQPTRWMGPRTIIREEVLTKQKSGRKIEVVLCSDLLLLLSGDRLYRIPMPLEEIVVRDVPAGLTGRDDFAFQVVHQGREKTNLRCNSARACHTWMHSIETARAECLAAANKSSRARPSYGAV